MVSTWLERLGDFRLVEEDFDGDGVLARYYRTGGYQLKLEDDIDNIRKDYGEFASEIEAIKFLRNGSDY